MLPVLHLRKQLAHPPDAMVVDGINVRHIVVPDDATAWLALRERAVAGLTPQPRHWKQSDFMAEIVNKPWWRSDWTWVAVAGPLRGPVLEPEPATRRSPAIETVASQSEVIGAVALALRESAVGRVPAVHWLLVDPRWRRHGIGRLLLSLLERAAWDAGWRDVQLETHAGWTEAVAFYQSLGYTPVH